MCVTPHPDTYDGDKAHNDEDNVQAEQQTVNDHPNHLPFLRGIVPLVVFVDLKADWYDFSA